MSPSAELASDHIRIEFGDTVMDEHRPHVTDKAASVNGGAAASGNPTADRTESKGLGFFRIHKGDMQR